MRSKLGTRSRLAAHIMALVLLILMLVYTSPESRAPESRPEAPLKPSVSVLPAKPAEEPVPPAPATSEGTLDRVVTPAVATRAEPEELRPPADPEAPRPERPAAPEPGIAAPPPERTDTLDSATSLRPHSEPLRPPANMNASEDEGGTVLDSTPSADKANGDETPQEDAVRDESAVDVPESVPAPESEEASPITELASDSSPDTDIESETSGEPDPEKAAEDETPAADPVQPGEPEAEAAPANDDETQPSKPQPDETESLVVAPSETGSAPVAAITPIPNANLEVLGDGVYWLDPRHDLETELATVPELRSLILLTPLPGYRAPGFEHVKTEAIPADLADLTSDAADRFIHLTTESANRPVVVAVLPVTRGAAFFKGVYLLRCRNMTEEDMLREIEPELRDAGEARDDIIHRLSRLKN